MPVIKLETTIHASIQVCFDLSRSIDLHLASTTRTKEKAIAGKTSGLIGLDEFVTWEATHFGIRQKLTTKITAYNRPYYFCDEQLQGPFKFLKHEHHFHQEKDTVKMVDLFSFESPYGIAGKVFSKLILTDYLSRFLIVRNNTIKDFAEGEEWKELLKGVS